jgi:hypothetical protein
VHNIVRQFIETGISSMECVRSKRNFTNSLTKPLTRRLVSKTSRGLGLIPKLWHCDWRSHEWGLMGNKVTSDHVEVLSFYVYPLSCWEDSDESIPMVYNSTWCRVIKDEFKTLNGSIVSTCWDVVFSAHTLDGCHLCKCGGGAASYETKEGL